MITKVKKLSEDQLVHIRKTVGEAFVTNDLFHDWGTVEERRDEVLAYMSLYVDFVYRSGELYVNENMTGFIGLEDSGHKSIIPRIRMILGMMFKIDRKKIKSLTHFAKQIGKANEKYAKERHLDALMVCVDKDYQGKGVASELVEFAKKTADQIGIPLLFDTDMKDYAEMYQYFGFELYNSVTADNSVTRYCLCYEPGSTR